MQMRKVLDWVCSLRWHGGVDPMIFLATVISLWSVVSAAETSGTCVCDQQCPKTRELVTTVWGGAFTLFVLYFDSWGKTKVYFEETESTLGNIGERFVIFIFFILNPIATFVELLEDVVRSYHVRWRTPGFTFWLSLLPWRKDPAKIVSGCEVVITFPALVSIPGIPEAQTSLCLSEALVIGCAQEESTNTTSCRLRYKEKGVLLEMDVLPPYDQLKVLQGNSGLATIISAVQSMGYIYGVVVRTIQGLLVSPIEVVAITLSIVILMKALIHNFASICHRPLHVYLTHEKALTFSEMCKKRKTYAIPRSQVVGPIVVMILLVSIVVIYYIIHMWETSIIMIIPMILTLVGLNLPVLLGVTDNGQVNYCIMIMCGMINATTYVFALVVTIKYWKVDSLNAKTSSVVAHIFPYIG